MVNNVTEEKKWIDDNETFKRFGYFSKNLSRKSNKKVVAKCSLCGKNREIRYYAYRDRCHDCQASQQAKEMNKRCRLGKNNPFYGKIHSEKTKEILSNIRKNNPTHLGKPASHGKHINYLRKNGNIIKLRSSWEEKVAKYLDSNNFKWEYENLTLPVIYTYNGDLKVGTFTIDFYISDKNEVWEVKGWWRDDAKEKFEAVKLQHPQYSFFLLDKNELKKMQLL